VPVAVRGRAEPVRVEVDGLQAGGQGSGHVVPEAVADVQHGLSARHAQSVEREAEDGRIRLGHADHRGVDDHAHRDARCLWPGPVRGVAHAEAAQFGLDGAVGVGDHAHRQAERGQGPQPGHHPGADVRPRAAHGRLGDPGGQVAALVLGHAAGREVADQILAPPGAFSGRHGGQVLDHHRPVVGPLERGHVRRHADCLQWRPQQVGLREDHYPACVEQDRADPRAHTRTICRDGRRQGRGSAAAHQSRSAASVWAVSSVPR
jgi:hypothetical protein